MNRCRMALLAVVLSCGTAAWAASEAGRGSAALSAATMPAEANSNLLAGDYSGGDGIAMVPESESLALLGLSLACIGVVRAVRQRKK